MEKAPETGSDSLFQVTVGLIRNSGLAACHVVPVDIANGLDTVEYAGRVDVSQQPGGKLAPEVVHA